MEDPIVIAEFSIHSARADGVSYLPNVEQNAWQFKQVEEDRDGNARSDEAYLDG
jgi:hypothetical protein